MGQGEWSLHKVWVGGIKVVVVVVLVKGSSDRVKKRTGRSSCNENAMGDGQWNLA